MSNIPEDLCFEIVHFGINCADDLKAKQDAKILSKLFGLPVKDGKSSIYVSPLLELMKGGGRGKCGHIAVATKDIQKAQKYLENLGCEFDPTSSKWDSEGNPIVIYLKNEISGFAIHLLQK